MGMCFFKSSYNVYVFISYGAFLLLKIVKMGINGNGSGFFLDT